MTLNKLGEDRRALQALISLLDPFAKISANICSSSSSESMSGQANGRTPAGRVDEALREEFPDGGI
jgi:hypothetical protein